MIRALWQALQDLNNLIDNNPEFWVKVQSVGTTMTTIGTYLTQLAQEHLTPTMGASSAPLNAEIDEDETILQLTAFLQRQGVAIPMAAPEKTRRERILELLELAIPLIAKLLLK